MKVSKRLIITFLAICAFTILSVAAFPDNKTKIASAWWKWDPLNPISILNISHEHNTDSTHQVLARAAYAYVYPIFADVFPAPDKGSAVITRYADYPDNIEKYENTGFSHLYYYPNPWTGQNAKTRFIYHYEKAIELYLENQEEPNINNIGAWGHLGAAIHYLCDLSTPVHTGDSRSANNNSYNNDINADNHNFFEAVGHMKASSISVTSFYFPDVPSTMSSPLYYLTLEQIVERVARASYVAYTYDYAMLSDVEMDEKVEWSLHNSNTRGRGTCVRKLC